MTASRDDIVEPYTTAELERKRALGAIMDRRWIATIDVIAADVKGMVKARLEGHGLCEIERATSAEAEVARLRAQLGDWHDAFPGYEDEQSPQAYARALMAQDDGLTKIVKAVSDMPDPLQWGTCPFCSNTTEHTEWCDWVAAQKLKGGA